MLTPRITCCKECADVQALINEINCKLYKLSLDAYNNIVFSLGISINQTMVFDLLNYKRILEYKLINENYACEFSVNMIANKVKKYVVGCKTGCDCNGDDLTPTTTTTTTTAQFNFDVTANWGNLGVTDGTSFENFVKDGWGDNIFPNPDFLVNDFLLVGNRLKANVTSGVVIAFNGTSDNSEVTSIDIVPNDLIHLECLNCDMLTQVNSIFPNSMTTLLISFAPITDLPSFYEVLNAIDISGCNFTTAKLDEFADMFLLGTLPKNSWNSTNQTTLDLPSPAKQTLLLAGVNAVFY